jgi:hypothetical protein
MKQHAFTQHRAMLGMIDKVRAAAKESKDSFLSVATDEKGKVTTSAVAAPFVREASMAREYMKSQLGSRPYKTVLLQQFAVQTSSANTALSTSLAADLAATGEWATMAAIFDECRCLEYKARTIVEFGGGVATMSTATIPVFAMATQFTTSVALASILISTKHVGPIPLMVNASTSGPTLQGSMTSPITKYGYVEVSSGPLEKSAVTPAPTSSSAPLQGAWIPTTASSGQGIVGYINQLTEALGASVIATTRTFGYYTVEFRLRQ